MMKVPIACYTRRCVHPGACSMNLRKQKTQAMIQNKYMSIVLLALLCFTVPNRAQDHRTLDTQVADLLARIPADNEQDLVKQMGLMLQLGEAGQQKILDLIIPPGTGDDTQARMAVESLSRHVSQAGMESSTKQVGVPHPEGNRTG
jgi:hypothetical protein